MDVQRVYVVVTVPTDHVDSMLTAIAEAGGGVVGEYTHCAFTSSGVGRFKPSGDASPFVGTHGAINRVDEWRIETVCPRDAAKAVVAAIRQAHPYEEPVIYVLPLIEEADL